MATLAQVATSDLTRILHALADRVRLHSEPEAEEIHDAIDSLDPTWEKPKVVTAPAQVLTGPDGQPVSPQAWATFLAFQAAEEAKARAAAAEAVGAPATPQAAAMTPDDVAALAAAHGLTVVPTETTEDTAKDANPSDPSETAVPQ